MFNINSFLSQNISKLKSYAESFDLSYHDAEDIASNVIVDFYQKYQSGKLNTDDNPQSYIYRLAKWRLVDCARRNIRHYKNLTLVGEDNNMDELPSESPKPDRLDVLISAFDKVKKIKHKKQHKFSNRDCEIFRMATFEDISAEDIAQKMQTTIPTVYLAKHRVGKIVIKTAQSLLEKE